MMLLVELVENFSVTFGERLSLVWVVHTHPPSELKPAQQTNAGLIKFSSHTMLFIILLGE
jgi:hypothetical protein